MIGVKMPSAFSCHNIRNLPMRVFITALSFHLVSLCYIQPRTTVFNPEGYNSYTLRYNVCVDNTTIRTQMPRRIAPGKYVFQRECCGCRVSDVTQRELHLVTNWPRNVHVFFFNDVHECQCITCDVEQFTHHLHLVELKH